MPTNRLLERAISLPFRIDANGVVVSSSSEEKIWQDKIVSSLMTRKGERIRRAQFGTSINAVSLSTLSVAEEEIRKEVREVFRVLLSPLILRDVKLRVTEDSSTVDLLITYLLPSANKEADVDKELQLAGFAAVSAEGTYFEERR